MRKRIVIVTLILSMLAVCGCGEATQDDLMKEKKTTIIEMYNSLSAEYQSLAAEYDTALKKLEQVYSDKELNPGVTSLGDGSGDLTLNSVKDRVQFNSSLSYPNASTVEASSDINITDTVSVVARDNWTTRLSNSTVELQHDNGISGAISVEKVTEYLTEGNIRESVLEPWVSEVTTEPVEYSSIFSNNVAIGTQGKCKVLVDGQTGTMIFGMLGVNDREVEYVFIYNGDTDAVKDEVIKHVIESINIYNTAITLE